MGSFRSSSSRLARFMGGGRREKVLSLPEWRELARRYGFDPGLRAARVGATWFQVFPLPGEDRVRLVLEA